MQKIESSVLNTFTQKMEVPFHFTYGGIYDMDKSYCIERQNSDRYLLLYTTAGEGRLLYKEKEYCLLPGSVFLIDCHYYQKYWTVGNQWRFYWVHFTADHQREYVDALYERYGAVFYITDGVVMKEHIRSTLSLFQGYDPAAPYQACGRIASMLGMLYSAACKEHSREDIGEDTKKTLRLIEERYNEKLTLDDIAREIGRSKYYLAHQFKEDTGIAVYGYLTLFRISKSKVFLQNTNLSVADIAEEIGFSSVSNFIRTFSEYENVTPHQYRKQWQVR